MKDKKLLKAKLSEINTKKAEVLKSLEEAKLERSKKLDEKFKIQEDILQRGEQITKEEYETIKNSISELDKGLKNLEDTIKKYDENISDFNKEEEEVNEDIKEVEEAEVEEERSRKYDQEIIKRGNNMNLERIKNFDDLPIRVRLELGIRHLMLNDEKLQISHKQELREMYNIEDKYNFNAFLPETWLKMYFEEYINNGYNVIAQASSKVDLSGSKQVVYPVYEHVKMADPSKAFVGIGGEVTEQKLGKFRKVVISLCPYKFGFIISNDLFYLNPYTNQVVMDAIDKNQQDILTSAYFYGKGEWTNPSTNKTEPMAVGITTLPDIEKFTCTNIVDLATKAEIFKAKGATTAAFIMNTNTWETVAKLNALPTNLGKFNIEPARPGMGSINGKNIVYFNESFKDNEMFLIDPKEATIIGVDSNYSSIEFFDAPVMQDATTVRIKGSFDSQIKHKRFIQKITFEPSKNQPVNPTAG